MADAVSFINGIIWSDALIALCLLAGLFFSIITRFVQVRQIKEMNRLLFAGTASEQGISSFQALAISLSGRVGVGNIAGVAAAIGFGGPGAVFWMWVVAFLGSSTAFIESTLGQIYKEKHDGKYRGGPAFYFEKGLGWRWLGIIFALFSILACGMFLPGVQANAVGNALVQVVGDGNIISTAVGEVSTNKIIGLAIMLSVLGFIIFGGIKRIAGFTQYVVPFMAFGYIIMAVLIVFVHYDKIPMVFSLIMSDIFSPQAGFGAAIGWGVKRGVYSNEAGQGTGPHAAAAAEVEHPAQQGLIQAFSVYIDTLFICSATAFMILITQMYNVQGTLEAGQFIVQNLPATTEINSPAFTQYAISSVFGSFGEIFVALAILFFAFTTILAYYYIAETNVVYLNRFLNTTGATFLIKLVILFSVTYGCLNASGYIWGFGDIGVGLMAWVNIIGVICSYLLLKPAIKTLNDYEAQMKQGVTEYTFDPKKLGIKGASFWENR